MPTLTFFAALREAAGERTVVVEATTVGEALQRACERYGERFARLLSFCSVVHRDETVDRAGRWDRIVEADDEIALLPPVSGGQDFRMVDVAGKDESLREATAVCRLVTGATTRDRILGGELAKGDPVAAARVAGTLAAKRTPELIPLCHPVRTTFVDVRVEPDGADAIVVRATVRGRDRTGFEMEALTACSIAALTLYDFAKAEDPRMRVEGLRIVAKSGGASGSVAYP